MVISKKTGLIITAILGFVVLSAIYSKVLFSSNQHMFNKSGDGNYFIYAWHIKHDTSYFHFDGISYPYGESISMDSLHIYSSFMKVLSSIFPSAEKYSIGFLNFAILISICIGAVFLYLILVYFKLSPLISAVSANAIAFTSSQIALISPMGHYGLTFVCFFPMAWYLLIKYYEKPKIITSLIIGLNTIFWTFSHVYLGFVISLFIVLVHFNWMVFRRKLPQNIGPFSFSLFLQLVLPFLVFFLLYISSGAHPDRIDLPFTLIHSNTFSSVFFPADSPFQFIYSWVNHFDFETNSWSKIGVYLGLITNIILLLFFAKIALSIVRRRVKTLKPFFDKNFDLFLLSAVILLLYSMAIPIKYFSPEILNKLPIIKQFSSLGRFGWGFYYVITVFCVVFVYKLTKQHKTLKYITYLVALLLFVEGMQIHVSQSKQISNYKNIYLEKNLNNDQKLLTQINKDEFQAILPIPYYFKFGIPMQARGTDSTIFYSQLAAYYTGLPIMSTYLSRPSVSESMNIYRQLLPFPFQKPNDKIVEDSRDILVITYNADSVRYNANEKLLLKKAELLATNNTLSIFRLRIKALLENENERNVEAFNQEVNYLHSKNKLLVSDTSLFFIYNDYKDFNSGNSYLGKGAFKGVKNQSNILCDTPTSVFDTALTYRLRLWYYNYVWDHTFSTLFIREKDSSGNNLTYDYYSPIKGEIIDGWWYLSERVIKIKSNSGRLKIFIHGKNRFKNEIYIDQFMLKPEGLNIYQLEKLDTNVTVIKNNKKFCFIDDME